MDDKIDIKPKDKESTKRASQISSMASTLAKLQAQSQSQTKKSKTIILKEQYGTSRGMEKVLSAVDLSIRNLAKASANLATLAKTVTFETARGVKNVTVGGFKTIKEAASQYGRALSEDIHWNKQNLMIGTIGRVSPLIGYFVAKFMGTEVMQNMMAKLKEKLNNALSSVSNRFKSIASAGWEKAKDLFSSVFKKGVVKTKVVSDKKGKNKKEKRVFLDKAREAKIIPHLAKGGFVTKEGVVKVHTGEIVQPAEKVVAQIVEQVEKRLGKKKSGETVTPRMEKLIPYKVAESKARLNLIKENTKDVKLKRSGLKFSQQMGNMWTRAIDSMHAAFGVVKSEQIIASKETRKKRGVIGTFINRYMGEVKEFQRPIQYRIWKTLTEIKQGIVSQKTFLGMSLDALQAAWQQTLHEHPLFTGLYLSAKRMTKMFMYPFKLIFNRKSPESVYKSMMPSGGTNVLESLLEATATTYVGQMHRLDQLIEYNKHILDSSRNTASAVGSIAQNSEVQDKMEPQKKPGLFGKIFNKIKSPFKGLGSIFKGTGIGALLLPLIASAGTMGIGGAGALGTIIAMLGGLTGLAAGAAVGGGVGYLYKKYKDRKEAQKAKDIIKIPEKSLLVIAIESLTKVIQTLTNKISAIIKSPENAPPYAQAVGDEFGRDQGTTGNKNNIISMTRRKKRLSKKGKVDLSGLDEEYSKTFRGKKEKLSADIANFFDPVSKVKRVLDRRKKEKDEKNAIKRDEVESRKIANMTSLKQLQKARKEAERMSPGKERDKAIDKINYTLKKTHKAQLRIEKQNSLIGKNIIQRGIVHTLLFKKQLQATLESPDTMAGKIANGLKKSGKGIWSILLMIGGFVLPWITKIFSPFKFIWTILKQLRHVWPVIKMMGSGITSLVRLLGTGIAGIGKLLGPLLGPGLALVAAGAAGAAIGTIINKFIGPKIQALFDKWDKAKSEVKDKATDSISKNFQTMKTSTDVNVIARQQGAIKLKSNLANIKENTRNRASYQVVDLSTVGSIQDAEQLFIEKNLSEFLKYHPDEITKQRTEWLKSGVQPHRGEPVEVYANKRGKSFLDYLKKKGVPTITNEELIIATRATEHAAENKKRQLAYAKQKQIKDTADAAAKAASEAKSKEAKTFDLDKLEDKGKTALAIANGTMQQKFEQGKEIATNKDKRNEALAIANLTLQEKYKKAEAEVNKLKEKASNRKLSPIEKKLSNEYKIQMYKMKREVKEVKAKIKENMPIVKSKTLDKGIESAKTGAAIANLTAQEKVSDAKKLASKGVEAVKTGLAIGNLTAQEFQKKTDDWYKGNLTEDVKTTIAIQQVGWRNRFWNLYKDGAVQYHEGKYKLATEISKVTTSAIESTKTGLAIANLSAQELQQKSSAWYAKNVSTRVKLAIDMNKDGWKQRFWTLISDGAVKMHDGAYKFADEIAADTKKKTEEMVEKGAEKTEGWRTILRKAIKAKNTVNDKDIYHRKSLGEQLRGIDVKGQGKVVSSYILDMWRDRGGGTAITQLARFKFMEEASKFQKDNVPIKDLARGYATLQLGGTAPSEEYVNSLASTSYKNWGGVSPNGKATEKSKGGVPIKKIAGMKATDTLTQVDLLNNVAKNQKETTAALKEGTKETSKVMINNTKTINSSVKSLNTSGGNPGAGGGQASSPHQEVSNVHSGRGLS